MLNVFLAMVYTHVLVAIFWIVYCVLHSVLASLSFKNLLKRKLQTHYKHYRLAYTLFACAGLIAILCFQFSIVSTHLFTPGPVTNIIGGVMGAGGLAIMLICIKKYFMSLSGLKSLTREEGHSELIISGIHRYVRHPLYLGTFLFIWGLFIVVPSLSILITDFIITLYTLMGIRLEEKKLVVDFGDRYTVYQKTVPKIIPRF